METIFNQLLCIFHKGDLEFLFGLKPNFAELNFYIL